MGNGTYSLKDYNDAFNEYKKFINIIHKNAQLLSKGYFVEKQNYEKFTNVYDNLRLQEQNLQRNLPGQVGQQNISSEALEANKMKTETIEGLKAGLLNNKEYILINKGLYQLICHETKNTLIDFYIKDNDLFICSNDGKNVIMRLKIYSTNMINKSSLYLTPSEISAATSNNISATPLTNNVANDNNANTVNYNKVSQDIINFYLNEKKISELLKSQNTQNYKGFLVEEFWINKWKTTYKYNDMEAKYLRNIINESQSQTWITPIVTDLSKSQINNDLIIDIKQYIIQDINQIKTSIKSYMLLDEKFLNSYIDIQNNNLQPTNFIISKNNIKIENYPFYFKSEKNLLNKSNICDSVAIEPFASVAQQQPSDTQNQINNNINNNENAQFLKLLLKYEYFKKDYYKPEPNFKIGYVVDYRIIKKLTEIFKSKAIFDNINRQINGIVYQNYEFKYNEILNRINTGNLNQPSNLEINNLKSEISNFSFLQKLNEPSNPNSILYADNFALIDPDLTNFLIKKFNTNIKMCQVNYKPIGNQIFMSLNLGQQFIYQISSFINNESFIGEYIIYPYCQQPVDITDYLFQVISGYGLQFWVNMKGILTSDNIIKFSIYRINHHLNQLPNNPQSNNIAQAGKGHDPIKSITEMPKQRFGVNNVSPGLVTTNDNNADRFRNSLKKQNSINGGAILNSNTVPNQTGNNAGNIGIGKDEHNLDKNLLLSISIINERQKLLNEINQPNGNRNDPKKEYYLINKNYLKTISDKLNLEKIFPLLQTNQFANENELLNHVKSNLNEKYKKELNDLKIEDIQKSLNKKENEFKHYFVNNDQSTNLLYYKHCDIISEKLLDSLKSIDPDINKKCQKVECVFDQSVVVIFINKYIINVAHFDNEIFVKQIIIAGGQNNNFYLLQIFNQFAQKGYTEFMRPFANSNNLINFNININNQAYPVQAHIYNITEDGKLVYMPSDILKTMILLAVSQIYNYPVNQKERVYLMNYKWLEEYKYSDIKEKIFKIIQSRKASWNSSYNFDSITNIIQLFGQEKLEKYDQKLQKITNVPCFPYDYLVPFEIPKKYIDTFRKFVLINDKMYEHFRKYFGISLPNDTIYHIYKSPNVDYLFFVNYITKNKYNPNNVQNYILIGNINRDSYEFIVSQIIDYKEKISIEKEIPFFIQGNIQSYMQTKNGQVNLNEMFLPIKDNNGIIGNYYNISNGFDPKKCVNNDLLSNNQLWAVIYLYWNELSIKRKLKNQSPIDEEFYFIKKQLFHDIRKQNNYEQLVKYFQGKINYNLPTGGDVNNIIKNLPQNDRKNLTNNLKLNQVGLDLTQIDIIPIQNPNNPNEMYWVLDKYELVEKHIANAYLNKYPYHVLKCSFLGNNMIVIHYPNNKFNNSKYFFLVSKIDEKDNITNEYLLIYNSPSYISHFNNIKIDLINFLEKQEYNNQTCPITVNGYQQIGTIIKLLDDYFPPIQLSITDSLEDFSSKPPVGLDNIGATCYMNATLECLINIKRFVDYFKYNKKLKEIVTKDTKKELLCSAFKKLIENIFDYKASKNYLLSTRTSSSYSKNSYAPKNFKNTISRMNSLFEGVQANDAKDLVNFLLMTLHTELNMVGPGQNDNEGNILLDQTNQALMFKVFTDNFIKTNRSIISDIFYAMNCNKTQCGNCQTISYNYQIYFFLIFPLEEVRKFRLSNPALNPNSMYLPNNTVDILDCFNFERKLNFMGGDNAMYCNYCKQTCQSSMCTVLTTGPEVLIIILNRGQGIQFDVKINFYTELNLADYIELQNTGCFYELIGVITHLGSSFIAYCKSYHRDDFGIWYRYNDSIRTNVSDFDKEVIRFGMPYLLFYKKKTK